MHIIKWDSNFLSQFYLLCTHPLFDNLSLFISEVYFIIIIFHKLVFAASVTPLLFVPILVQLTSYFTQYSFIIHFILWQDDSSLIKLWFPFFIRHFSHLFFQIYNIELERLEIKREKIFQRGKWRKGKRTSTTPRAMLSLKNGGHLFPHLSYLEAKFVLWYQIV